MGLGPVRIERQRAIETRERLFRPLEPMQRDAAIVMGGRIVGRQGHRAIKGCQSIPVPRQTDQREARVRMGADRVWIVCKRVTARRECVVVAAKAMQLRGCVGGCGGKASPRGREIGLGGLVRWIRGDGFRQEFGGAFRTARIQREKAEQGQGRRVVRLLAQNLLIGRFRHLALLMERYGLLQGHARRSSTRKGGGKANASPAISQGRRAGVKRSS